MGRREWIKRFITLLALGGVILLGTEGCEKYPQKELKKFGNQEKLWQVVTSQEELKEPIELIDTKDTPVLYRDASMGKADPNFTPKLTGG